MLRKKKTFELASSVSGFDLGKCKNYNYRHFSDYDVIESGYHCISGEFVRYSISVRADGRRIRISKFVCDDNSDVTENEYIFSDFKGGEYTYRRLTVFKIDLGNQVKILSSSNF